MKRWIWHYKVVVCCFSSDVIVIGVPGVLLFFWNNIRYILHLNFDLVFSPTS